MLTIDCSFSHNTTIDNELIKQSDRIDVSDHLFNQSDKQLALI